MTFKTVLEKGIEHTVNVWARSQGWMSHKINFGDAGYPDRLYVNLTGYCVWIEFKRPGREPDPIQYHRMMQMLARGMDVTWTDNVSDAMDYLNARKHLHTARLPDKSDKTPTESS